ncbi:glycosyltransferase involved in cell wall biosynthesis [Methanolinea mesophila]|uniref:glycosyltransferase family 4 protein n=1 Tax=Methanolinea mesophila TaxID=547055 RepID=UPI001AE23DCB|nr:glycosyltransferase family 4 protein [Methanolinea mesophila]MBP1928347.1 glycosyltransferase involved in cell wall biosynthesis [Methanolinea mesophila]
MKIAIVTSYWKNSQGGGLKNYLINLVDIFKKKGYNVSVLFREGDDPQQYQCGINKIWFCFNCYRHLRRIKPSVIHSQGAWFCLFPSVVYKKIYKCRLVHTFHTAPTQKLSVPARFFFQWILNNCDCITFVSKSLQQQIIEMDKLVVSRTKITYAGVQPITVTDDEVKWFREQHNIDKDAIVLLAIGMTALSYKAEGLKKLISAIHILRERYPNILLIVTRNAKYSEELRAFSNELGINKQLIFIGDIINPFVPLKLCSIYTHTPLGEGGVSLAVLEAMSMGKPIIATNVGGIPEAIDDGVNGILIEPDSIQIAAKIDLLLQNKEYAEMIGQFARNTAEKNFNWEKTAEQFLKAYSGQ